jgi:HSP20 family molecular chaperone IbpA
MFDIFDVLFKEWTRPVKEVDVRHVYKKDYGYLLVINVLGIPEKRLLIDISEGNNLVITGDIELEEINFKNKVSYELSLGRVVVDKIEYTVKDGILYVEVHEDKPQVKKITINKK